MPVACDGERIAEVKQGFFFAVNLPPGRHSLSLADGVPVSVDLRLGEEAFVRVDWNHDVRRRPIPVLNSVVAERAKREMRLLSYVDAKRIHAAADSGSDPRSPEKPQLKAREPE
jgi:hypothetical protein